MEFEELKNKVTSIHQIYSKKFGVDMDKNYALHKLYEEIGEFTSAWLAFNNQSRPEKTQVNLKEQLSHELSDIIGIALLNAEVLDIDLEKALEEKWFKYLPNEK